MTSFLISVILIFISGIFVWWLNKKECDVRYTITEGIQTRQENGNISIIKQLTVKNIGKAQADDICVTLPENIIHSQIEKNSIADSPSTYDQDKRHEIMYPHLPPDGQFKVILTVSSEDERYSEIAVKHSKGQASNALSNRTSFSSILSILGIGMPLLYVLITANSFISWKQDNDITMAKYDSEEKLSKSKPFYHSDESWKKYREVAIKGLLESRLGNDITELEDSVLFRFLNKDKPTHISNEEWEAIKVPASEIIINAFTRKVNLVYKFDECLYLLKIKPPIYVPVVKWTRYLEAANYRFLQLYRNDTRDIDSIRQRLKLQRPDEIIDVQDWNFAKQNLQSTYADLIRREVEFCKSPSEALKNYDLSILPESVANDLRRQLYRVLLGSMNAPCDFADAKKFLEAPRPDWICDVDYSRLKVLSEKVVKHDVDSQSTDAIFKALTLILADELVGDSVFSKIDQQSVIKLKELDSAIRKRKIDLVSINKDLERSLSKLETDRRVIVRQLEILHSIFIDPSCIDRIESYDTPFALGNMETLKNIAKILKAKDALTHK